GLSRAPTVQSTCHTAAALDAPYGVLTSPAQSELTAKALDSVRAWTRVDRGDAKLPGCVAGRTRSVITKKMKGDFSLAVDPCADVEDVSTKGHRTYTFEQPNSLSVDELSTFFETAWEKYPQHFAVILLGSV